MTKPPPHRRSGPPSASGRGRPPPRPEKLAPDRTTPDLGPDGTPQVALVRRGVERWQAGHPWIYRADLNGDPALAGGEVVRVVDGRGWFIGKALYSKHSKISLRWLSYDDVAVDADFFRQRLQSANALRQQALPGEQTYRLVHGEADGLPGLVVDRYGDYLSAQFLVPAMEQRKELIADLLEELLHPRGIVNRSDVGVRALEGLPQEKGLLRGALPPGPVSFDEGLVRMRADLLEGQKTGAFLDQRENHVMAAQYASGDALDCFSYVGGFALQLATRARHVTAVEISEAAGAQLRDNAAANKLSNLDVVTANAFDFLRDAVDEGRRFDTIVLDPPSFAKNKDAIAAAVRGYKEINLRALQLLKPGGILISASCTYHVDEQAFEDMLASAAADARRRVQIIERRGAGRDHPVLLNLRETRYLKCFVLRVL
ncbi:methyltransferase [Corallococcus sp. H22C18031201]|uniref:class I SAM-dependent rRNA methyltransferase n=1 Tax=Citreicoccus inhibens TaxID=2849499 RepID=UPI000E75DDE6|nr:class I SAM-dependent rRNA methyltransferase [Citreicoccus inhibens]MBU8897733.1 class I SAM-dependent rRNA methyltransferase [Citreicoccus inhibens]RJS27500.1 methyltransferase [Corallococcus sp. H22C18031201]